MRQMLPITALLFLVSACGVSDAGVTPTAMPAPAATATEVQPAASATSIPSATPSASPTAPATATPTAPATATPTAPATATPTAPATATPTPGQPADSSPTPEPTLPTRPLPTRIPAPPAAPPVTGEVPADLLDRIIADVLQRTGAQQDAVTVVRAEAVTWPDGSLGCPQPGMAYLQVLIEGYWVVLQVGDAQYDYRVDDRGRFSLCPMP